MHKISDLINSEKLMSTKDLFKITDPNIIGNGDIVKEIKLSDLHTYKNHPFKVVDDEKMKETVESISKHGVLVPIIARKSQDGQAYEIISGHRRKRACEILELETIPTIVREMTDEESVIIMVDSNIQREELLYSEKAFAYKMKLDAIKSQGKRNDLTCDQLGHKLKTRDMLAKNSDDSGVQIQRYIRLTELITDLLRLIDEKKLAFNTGVELSYLNKNEQTLLFSKMNELSIKPSIADVKQLRKYSLEENGNLTSAMIESVLLPNFNEKNSPTESTKPALKKYFQTKKIFENYFDEDVEEEYIENLILSLLNEWKNKNTH